MRHQIKRHPERARPERLHEILNAGYVAHVSYCEAGQPYSIPFAYQFDPQTPDYIYLHGGHASHSLQLFAQGIPVCINITLLDALIYSRTALHHSMNFRSVVLFGRGQIENDLREKRRILEGMIARCYAGRMPERDYAVTPEAHLETTLVIAVKIERSSVKIREAGATGPEDSQDFLPGSAGVLPIPTHYLRENQVWVDAEKELCISTDPYRLKAEAVYALLQGQYWTEGLSLERVQRFLQHSLAFGLYHNKELVGFTRITHDGDRFAYLADMIICPQWRGQGVGKWLLSCVLKHPVVAQGKCLLMTRDAHDFYRGLGFQALPEPAKMMILRKP